MNSLKPRIYRARGMTLQTKFLSVHVVCHVDSETSVCLSGPNFHNPANDLPFLVITKAGAMIIGRYSDRIIVRCRNKRGGIWCPEDRLWAAIPGAFLIAPLSVLCSGLIMEYIPGRLGLALTLLCFFFTGLGVRILSLIPSESISNRVS